MDPEQITPESLKSFLKEAKEQAAQIAEERLDAVGLLTPELLNEHLESGQDLVLAYGRKGGSATFKIAGRTIIAKDGFLTLTLRDLKALVAAQKRKLKKYQSNKGVPLLLLEKSSDRADIQRSKGVHSATLFRIDKNLLFFQVSGNSKPRYLVKIRLEDWETAVMSPILPLVAARMTATGRLSIECPCGRHQYWYRYLATIGGFAIDPLEQDFPKIRNPGLTGCCCKHVLKVLRVLKSNTIHAVLAKELERQRKNVGFASKIRAKFLSKTDLQQTINAKDRRISPQEAKDALERFKKGAATFLDAVSKKKNVREMQKRLKPRNKPTKPASGGKELTASQKAKLIAALQNARTLTSTPGASNLGFTMKKALENIAENHQKWGVTVTTLKSLMKENNI